MNTYMYSRIKIVHNYITAHAKLFPYLLVFSTMSCLSIVLSLANSLCHDTGSLGLNERDEE